MSSHVSPEQSQPATVILPFFLVAPLGLVMAGVAIVAAGPDLLIAAVQPRTIAIVHLVVLGWATTTIFGALYQMGPVVFGARPAAPALLRVHLLLHVLGVGLLAYGAEEWRRDMMVAGGLAVAGSFALFLLTAGRSIVTGTTRGPAREFVIAGFAALVGVGAMGLAFVGSLRWGWFTISDGRVAAHAHLGAVGWLSLVIMGVSYQLVPMFSAVSSVRSRLGRPALAATVFALTLFVAAAWWDPSPAVRAATAAGLAVGPLLWSADQLRILRGRARRLDIQGRGTVCGIVMLWLAAAVGVVLAAPGFGDGGTAPARWLVAYGALGLVGWPGAVLVGNSYKIVPFLVWYHRYRPLIGRRRVPTLAELYSERWAAGVLGMVAAGVLAVAMGAAGESGAVVRAGGILLAAGGVAHTAGLLSTLRARRSPVDPFSRPVP